MQDLEKVYDEKINPLMAQIIAICIEHDLPMFATFQYTDEELCTSCILPEGCSKVLHEAKRLVYSKPAFAMEVTIHKPTTSTGGEREAGRGG